MAKSSPKRPAKAPTRKATANKTASKKTAKKTAAKAARKKAPAKPAPAKKAPAKKAAAKQPRATKTAETSGLLAVLRPDGTVIDGRDPNLATETLLYLYEQMVQVREFDRRMLMLQRQGRIGFYGPILGQEAATVGSVAATEDRDWIIPALREGAAAMMRGLPLDLAVAQLIGNEMDRCKGRQMPCHYTHKEGNYYSMSSVIGTQISHAAGVAMAAKIKGDDIVVLGYMGDGATNANDFHAGMNFAAVYQAPVVMICQNNQWAISVPVKDQLVSETIAIRSEAYGMPGVRVDGNDVLAVYVATRQAVDRARRGEGPTFLELVTYRRLGHTSSDDPSRYRDESEVEVWKKRDPVDRFRRYLEHRGIWDEAKEAAFMADIAERVNAAIKTAEAASHPPAESLITDVFADVPANLQRHYDDSITGSGIVDSDGHFPL